MANGQEEKLHMLSTAMCTVRIQINYLFKIKVKVDFHFQFKLKANWMLFTQVYSK